MSIAAAQIGANWSEDKKLRSSFDAAIKIQGGALKATAEKTLDLMKTQGKHKEHVLELTLRETQGKLTKASVLRKIHEARAVIVADDAEIVDEEAAEAKAADAVRADAEAADAVRDALGRNITEEREEEGRTVVVYNTKCYFHRVVEAGLSTPPPVVMGLEGKKDDWRTMYKEDAQKIIDDMAVRAGSALADPNDPLHELTLEMEDAHRTDMLTEAFAPASSTPAPRLMPRPFV